MNVPPAAAPAVAAQEMAQPPQQPWQQPALVVLAPGGVVAVEQLQQGGQIRAVPVAVDVALGEADGAPQEESVGDAAATAPKAPALAWR